MSSSPRRSATPPRQRSRGPSPSRKLRTREVIIEQVVERVATSGSVSYLVLTPAGYMAWSIKMEAILNAQGLWEVVSPSSGAEVDAWKNKMARANLLQALPEDILM